jgi:hypothetical protein
MAGPIPCVVKVLTPEDQAAREQRRKMQAPESEKAAEQQTYARAPDGPGYTPGTTARPIVTQRPPR